MHHVNLSPNLICVKTCDLNFARKLTLSELDRSFIGSLETLFGDSFWCIVLTVSLLAYSLGIGRTDLWVA